MEDFMQQRFLRIGIIGTGFNAQFHIRSFVSVRNCLITGFVSRSPGNSRIGGYRFFEIIRTKIWIWFGRPYQCALLEPKIN